MKVGIGDFVRSYDFEGNRDCYVVGLVVGVMPNGKAGVVGHPCYKLYVLRRIWDGKPSGNGMVSDFCYPPINGTPKWLGGVTNSVEWITRTDAIGDDSALAEYLRQTEDEELTDARYKGLPVATAEHYAFLDDLRDSGSTNMFGAGAVLEKQFGLSREAARDVLTGWMKWYISVENE